jgi:adenine-specific DNA-methyltransferase
VNEANVQKVNPGDPETKSEDVLAENIAQLGALFPEALTEGRIDFDVLRHLLGDAVEDREEKYGLTWHGKRRARQIALTPSTGTLRPCPDESVEWDTTQNLIIEGDNLEVLKLLQKSYAGKVKLIYIDPPYNTGNDFVYPDDFSDNIKNYLELTGQVESGGKISTNTETSGRFHTDWLNMMYPRLKLARNLLQEDGVIFISIDDGEVRNLRALCDEVFGEEDFIATLTVQSNPRGRHLSEFIAQSHEYVLAYARNAEEANTIVGLEKAGDALDAYNKEDELGRYREMGLRNSNRMFNPRTRPTLWYPLFVNPASGTVSVERSAEFEVEVWPVSDDGVETCWTWSPAKVIADNELLVARMIESGSWRVFRKDYLVGGEGQVATTLAKSIWMESEFNIDNGSRRVRDLLGDVPLQFPKAPALLDRLLRIGSGPGDLILDFFAGAGVTADAVLTRNGADGGRRRFILVQLPEPTGRDDFPTIADITKERVRRVIQQLDREDAAGLELRGGAVQDRGFRVFKLDATNIQPWEPDHAELEQTLEDAVEHLKTDRTEQDILYEVLLKLGLDLCVRIETREIAGKEVHAVGGGALLTCLAPNIGHAAVEDLALGIAGWLEELAPAGDASCVFRDSAFEDDVAKTNMAAILAQHGLTHVRSL